MVLGLAQVRFSSHDAGNGKRPPTAVMVHGILGSRRNMHAFAKRLSEVSTCLLVVTSMGRITT